MKSWIFLSIAIIAEVVGTSALKSSEGFSRLYPSIIVILGYVGAFYFLSLTLKTIPIGVAYAIWAGLGTALITAVGWCFFNQKLSPMALIGISFVLIGVILINLSSKHI